MAVKYLIRSDGTYYNVTDGALTSIDITDLSAEVFTTYGNDALPVGELLVGLSSPSVLCWTDGEELPQIAATVTATPLQQTVISDKIDLTHATIKGIEAVTATCEGDLVCAVSFDDKQTWQAWDGTEWLTLSSETAGMSKDALEAITVDQWALLCDGATGFYIRVTLTGADQAVSKIYVDFANQESEDENT